MAFKFRSRQVADPAAQQNFEQLEGIIPVGPDNLARVPHCIVRRAALQTVVFSANTTIAFDTVDADPLAMYASPNITIPRAGLWEVFAQGSIDQPATGGFWTFQGGVLLNGAVNVRCPMWNILGNSTAFVYVTSIGLPMVLAKGDTLSLFEYQNALSGGMNTYGGGGQPILGCVWRCPA